MYKQAIIMQTVGFIFVLCRSWKFLLFVYMVLQKWGLYLKMYTGEKRGSITLQILVHICLAWTSVILFMLFMVLCRKRLWWFEIDWWLEPCLYHNLFTDWLHSKNWQWAYWLNHFLKVGKNGLPQMRSFSGCPFIEWTVVLSQLPQWACSYGWICWSKYT